MKRTHTLCLFVLLALNVSGQSIDVDSLVNVLETQKLTNKERIELCSEIVDKYVQFDLDKASVYTEKGLKLAEKEDDKIMESKFNDYFGEIYYKKSSHDTALIYFNKALTLVSGTKDKNLELTIYLNIGASYGQKSKYSEALEYFLKALSLCEITGNQMQQSKILSNIGGLYRMLGNSDQAVTYLEKAKALAEEIDFPLVLVSVYYELGGLYSDMGDLDKGIEYDQKAIEINKIVGNKSLSVYCNQSLAMLYCHYEDYDKALEYANESLSAAQELGEKGTLSGSWVVMSNIYLAQENWKEGEMAALEAWKMDSVRLDFAPNIAFNIVVSNIYLENKDKAIDFLLKYRDFKNQYNDKSFHETLTDMEVKYETEKKEMRIASLEKERQLYVWLGIAGVLFICALVIVLWLTIRSARRERLLIATRSVLDGEMRERTRLAQDLHDRLSGNLSAVKIELDDQVESMQKVRDKLDKCIREVREAAHDIMPPSLRFGLKVALEDFAAQFPNVRFHFFGKENRLEKRIEFVVYCCVNELVTNAIRHSGAKHINVQLVQGENHVALTVQDDGCGFDEKTVTKGLGLQSIHNRVASCNGKMDIFSSSDKGTEIIIELKVKS
jgi:signal transduction histidine kinase/Tfp pilus assembly protein PilF